MSVMLTRTQFIKLLQQVFVTLLRIDFKNFSGSSSIFVGRVCGKQNGIGQHAQFNVPRAIAVDQQTGNLYVTDQSNHMIRKISSQGLSLIVLQPHFSLQVSIFNSHLNQEK